MVKKDPGFLLNDGDAKIDDLNTMLTLLIYFAALLK